MGQETTTLFSGTFERSMDAKKRVAVPSAWVPKGESVVWHVVPHASERYLMVMPREELEKWEAKFENSDAPPKEKRKAIRTFFGSAREVMADKQGRIVLDDRHCEWAGLTGDVVFLGGKSRFEIWSGAHFAAEEESHNDAYQRVAEAIGL